MPRQSQGRARERRRVLLVEDDLLVQETMHDALEAAGYAVTTADEGRRALPLLARKHHDAVITDILMPGRGGLDTIRDIRRSFPMMVILAVSAAGDADNRSVLAVAVEHGADRTLAKPFKPLQLVQALDELLSARHAA